jgi:thiol-disulfide isomerase/thioredoxin
VQTMASRVLATGVALTIGSLPVPVVSPVGAQEAPIGLARGASPPGVALERLDGEGGVVDLGEVIGTRPVLLEFWATWCPNCEELHPHLLGAHRAYGDRVAFFAIAVGVNQSPRRIRRHLERHPLPFPMLWDERGAATRAFEAPNTSYIVVLDADGKVTYTGTGAHQDVAAAVRSAL